MLSRGYKQAYNPCITGTTNVRPIKIAIRPRDAIARYYIEIVTLCTVVIVKLQRFCLYLFALSVPIDFFKVFTRNETKTST